MKDLEEILEDLHESGCLVSHKGISVVPGEGLRGGGPIDRTVSIALDLGELELKVSGSLEGVRFGGFDFEENQHCQIPFHYVADAIIRDSGLLDQVSALANRVKDLEEQLRLLSVYERLERAELKLKELENARR